MAHFLRKDSNVDRWRAPDREKHLVYERRYRDKNRERYNDMNRARAAKPENREKKRIRSAKYREANRLKLREKFRAYYAHNKPTYLRRSNSRRRLQRKTDLNYKIKCILRSRFSEVLKAVKLNKEFSVIDLVGCDMPILKAHLETKFTGGMSWENHGTFWHVDHIKPCSKFDLSNPDHQRACFHYTNLQPLTAFENISKNNKWQD